MQGENNCKMMYNSIQIIWKYSDRQIQNKEESKTTIMFYIKMQMDSKVKKLVCCGQAFL